MSIAVNYNGTTYYVDVIMPTGTELTATIYFSTTPASCSATDLAISLKPRIGSFADYQNIITAACRTRKIVDTAFTMVGCLAVIGSAFCVFTVEPTAGASVFLCEPVWEYAAVRGVGDCIQGVSGAVADILKLSPEWIALTTGYFAGRNDLGGVLSNLIDEFCDTSLNPIFP